MAPRLVKCWADPWSWKGGSQKGLEWDTSGVVPNIFEGEVVMSMKGVIVVVWVEETEGE